MFETKSRWENTREQKKWAVHVREVEHRKNITKVNIAKRVNQRNVNVIDPKDVPFQFYHIQSIHVIEAMNEVHDPGKIFAY